MASEGLSWTWELDFETLLAALQEPPPWSSRGRSTVNSPSDPAAEAGPVEVDPVEADPAEVDPAEAEFAEILSAMEDGRSRVVPLTTVAGQVAESLPTGPDLAGWLATGAEDQLEDGALVGVAASYRRLASWAQAGELAAVAELASRSASADERIGTDKQGRPARLPDEACAQVSLGLTMSHSSATCWSDLAVTLRWRLPATGAALRSGAIDLGRARAIAEATAALDDQKARMVEDRVLSGAGNQTMGQLRAALRRAVITADPQGAERRRLAAERRARVMLYPDAEGTASLAGHNLPGVSAAAAMARISALARALKASGSNRGIDLLRAEVFIGLLLGTLPYIPPAADGPPDPEPPADDSPAPEPPADDSPAPEPPPTWPEVPVFLQPGPAAMGYLRPAQGGMLDLRLSWGTLAGESAEPGYLGRFGPVTPAQARQLAEIATGDRAVDWRVVVTGPDNRALSVGRIPPKRARASPVGLVKRVTVSITLDQLAQPAADLPPALSSVLSAAERAVSVNSANSANSREDCSHAKATAAYRPSPWLREFVVARDQTCRFLTCRQPAWRCDLDHTEPYEQGGRTCACNLGCLCRFHHQLKQHRRWQLVQSAPGTFTWITPGGRTYATLPDSYPA